MPWDDVPNSEVGSVGITDVFVQLRPIEFYEKPFSETGTVEIVDISISLIAA